MWNAWSRWWTRGPSAAVDEYDVMEDGSKRGRGPVPPRHMKKALASKADLEADPCAAGRSRHSCAGRMC